MRHDSRRFPHKTQLTKLWLTTSKHCYNKCCHSLSGTII